MDLRSSQRRAPRAGRIGKILLIGLPVLFLVAVILGGLVLPGMVRSRVSAYTGCVVEAEEISINPFRGTVRLVDFRLHNPADFPVPDFVELKLLDVRVKLLSLRREVVEIPYLHFDVPTITVVTRQDGTTNTSVVRSRAEQASAGEDDESSPASSERRVHIDDLVVRLGKIELVDYSRGGEPVRRTIPLNIDRRFTDVTDLKAVTRVLIADVARNNAAAGVLSLGALLPGQFGEAIGGVLQNAGGTLRDSAGPLGEVLKKLIDSRAQENKP